MRKWLKSAGIDIGTSTTQVLFSELEVVETEVFGMPPRIEIVDKKVTYRSPIYLTPLREADEIDGQALAVLIEKAYNEAGVLPDALDTGAMIITGESARKRNAKDVMMALSKFIGQFVVAAAGPELESILAGKGSGAMQLSENNEEVTVNVDIGGGTSNICFFRGGKVLTCGCMDIGGRLIKLDKAHKVTYISKKMDAFLKAHDEQLKIGDVLTVSKAKQYASWMAAIICEAIGLKAKEQYFEMMITSMAPDLKISGESFIFSGGVGSCMQQLEKGDEIDFFQYGDLGFFLAAALCEALLSHKVKVRRGKEMISATVMGAGQYSMSFSGSTIEYKNAIFPYKNVPAIKLEIGSEKEIASLSEKLMSQLAYYQEENRQLNVIALDLWTVPSYQILQQIAYALKKGMEEALEPKAPLIVATKQNVGKALGLILRRLYQDERPVLCIDEMDIAPGDYLDFLAPIMGGKVIPVVVKTLVFIKEG